MEDQESLLCQFANRCSDYNSAKCDTHAYQVECSIYDARQQASTMFRQAGILGGLESGVKR